MTTTSQSVRDNIRAFESLLNTNDLKRQPVSTLLRAVGQVILLQADLEAAYACTDGPMCRLIYDVQAEAGRDGVLQRGCERGRSQGHFYVRTRRQKQSVPSYHHCTRLHCRWQSKAGQNWCAPLFECLQA
jgi:hypothetical protein